VRNGYRPGWLRRLCAEVSAAADAGEARQLIERALLDVAALPAREKELVVEVLHDALREHIE
jgi:hypothetical protein